MTASLGGPQSRDSPCTFGGVVNQEESLIEASVVELGSLAEGVPDQFVGEAEFFKS
jgi:hypothetical protein